MSRPLRTLNEYGLVHKVIANKRIFMSPIFKNITMIYIIFLSAVAGVSLYAGIVVAPVTFGTEGIFGEKVLSRYQEGMIMTQNFVRLSFAVTLSVIVAFLYESYKYKMGERDMWTFIALFTVIATGIMFSFYYLPDIVSMQQLGEQATQTETFNDMHKGSSLDFKIFIFATLMLIVRNLQKALK